MKTDHSNYSSKRTALRFIVLLGVVSLLADMTYEGARSITGPYLAILGASGTIVGIVAGLGELIGYGLRLVSGYITDRTGKLWTITIIGYAVNLLAVPLLALAGRWETAAFLMITERMGKAIRTPAKDAMLSHATVRIGRGFGFGLHEAMDQVGAVLGPLIVAGVLYFRGDYHLSFAVLLVPALLALSILFIARTLYPYPRAFETGRDIRDTKVFPQAFWIYLAGVALVASGYVDFPLIAYHFKIVSVIPDDWVPIFYAVAMGVDALAALLFGNLFDRIGIPALMLAALISSVFAPLVFFGGFHYVLLGMAIWGIGMGAQESIMRAAVAEMVNMDKRGTAYGIFNTGYGIFWFLGSALMGILYDISVTYLIAFSMIMQLASVPVFFLVRKLE